MALMAGSEVGGRLGGGLKELLSLSVVLIAYPYTPLDNPQEKARILSAPLLPTGPGPDRGRGRQARSKPVPL
jgi:hypothetical protein